MSRHHPTAYPTLFSTEIILKDCTLLSVLTECSASYSGLLTNLLIPMVPVKKNRIYNQRDTLSWFLIPPPPWQVQGWDSNLDLQIHLGKAFVLIHPAVPSYENPSSREPLCFSNVESYSPNRPFEVGITSGHTPRATKMKNNLEQ